MRVSYISLGCPKNELDLELILGSLFQDVEIVTDVQKADAVIINTCAFITDAKTEAIDTILSAIRIKAHRPEMKILVTGCLPQRFQEELSQELPEVDSFFTWTDPFQTAAKVNRFLGLDSSQIQRYRLTPKHYAYLRIADGCNNRCSYCAIPLIKGSYKSRALPDIIEESQKLASDGVRELLLVAQDITYFGRDHGQQNRLIELLCQLQQINELAWIRLLYTHPAHWNGALIEVVSSLEKVVPYIDLPIQHISDRLLRKMRRKVTAPQIRDLVEQLRAAIPEVALRTSLIVGFPGETESDFQELCDFVQSEKFERLGVFRYSHEEGTAAFSMSDDVPEAIKKARQEHLMELQMDISRQHNQKVLGKTVTVLSDEQNPETHEVLGRTKWDAPEIDNTVHLEENAKIGEFFQVRIDKVDCYDLWGQILQDE